MTHPRLLLLLPFLPLFAAAPAAAAETRTYHVDFHATFEPEQGRVLARIVVDQPRSRLTLLDLDAPEPRYSTFAADGTISREDDRLIWRVPAEGGELRYQVLVDHEREGAPDARLTGEWAIVRLDDLFPPVRVKSRVNTRGESRLYLDGPEGWSFETRYGPVDEDGVPVETRGRRFDRPLGWLAAGELGIRRMRIAERRVAIAGPRDEGFHRMDVLTFLRWTLPELVRIAPTLPERVLIVGGSRDMWRGGLSGPGSLYVHPDRPLVSGNSTSTLLHELMHVATEEPPEAGADWIAEGLAEYYSLVVLLRSGGISGRRFEHALEDLEEWAREDDGTLTDPSTGADTAHAVLLFRDLDLELRESGASLDTVAARLLEDEMDLTRLSTLTAEALGAPSTVLAPVIAAADEEGAEDDRDEDEG